MGDNIVWGTVVWPLQSTAAILEAIARWFLGEGD